MPPSSRDYSPAHLANLLDAGYTSREVADRFDLTPSGVRGMVSRFRSNKVLAAVDYPPPKYEVNPSERRVLELIERGQGRLRGFLAEDKTRTFLYTSDHHWPYQDDRAISLNIQIAALLKPDLVTGLSDFFDFDDYSHWPDYRTPAARLWGSDIQRPIDLHGAWIRRMEGAIGHKPLWLGLWGNHDLWLYEYLTENQGGASMYTFATFLEELENQGLTISGWPERKHAVRLSPRLKMLHGVNASKNPSTVAKNTLEEQAGKSWELDAGQFYNVIYGHDHRSIVFDYYGATAYGAGCNCDVNMPYLHSPAQWQLGVVIGHFNPQSTLVDATRINFYPTADGGLTCFVGDVQLFS